MGLFSKNWTKELDRAEDLLRRDLPAPALEIAKRATIKAESGVRERAAAMVESARQAVLASVLAKAAAAESGGNLEDAADWLLAAIEQEPSADRRNELGAKRQALLDRAERADGPWAGELMALVANARQGHLESQDLEIMAAYYEATGDTAAAKDAASEALRLAETGGGGTINLDPAPRTGRIL